MIFIEDNYFYVYFKVEVQTRGLLYYSENKNFNNLTLRVFLFNISSADYHDFIVVS